MPTAKGCPGIAQRLQDAVRKEYLPENHPKLHRLLNEGSANAVRQYLYKGMNLALTPAIRQAIDRGECIDPLDYDRMKAIRRQGLYHQWVQASRRRGRWLRRQAVNQHRAA